MALPGMSLHSGLRLNRLAQSMTTPPTYPEPHDRALELLLSWLTPRQRKRLARTGVLRVKGSHTGRNYYLTRMRVYNVTSEDNQELCFAPHTVGLPWPDVMLAQKLSLEHDEPGALRVANARDRQRPIVYVLQRRAGRTIFPVWSRWA